MPGKFVAKSQITIDAPAAKVWKAITTPEQIKQYFFGVDVVTDWKVGSPILQRGEWQGKKFEDKGKIVAVDRPNRLVYTHFSPAEGKPDKPENYHNVTFTLKEQDGRTKVTLGNDNNGSAEGVKHAQQNWKTVLKGLKQFVEKP